MKRTILAVFLFFAFIFFASFDAQLESISGKNENDPFYSLAESGIPQWARTYGGQEAEECERDFTIQETNDGGYIVAGNTGSFGAGSYDIWILKLTSYGEVEWQRAYGGSGTEYAYTIYQTGDGGYIVAGYTWSFGTEDQDIWVLKLNSSGDVEWQKAYEGSADGGHFLLIPTDGGYIIAGETESFGAGGIDIWVLRLSSNGDVEWQRTYGGSSDDLVFSFWYTEDGGYIIAGGTESFGAGGTDIWVLKLSSNGDVEWQRTYGGNFDEFADTIRQTKDGGYILGGRTYTFGVGGFDCWILKLSSSGAIEWQKTYGGGGDWDNCASIQETSDGGYIFAGGTNSFDAGSHDAWIIKLNSNGSIVWQRSYGGSEWEYLVSIQETSDGGYIVAGGTWSFGVGSWELLVLKLSPDGEIGPSCGLRVNLNAAVADTSVSPSDTNIAPMNTNVTPRSTNASPQNTEGRTMILCWNLNQPPVNVSLKREINRSLFQKEALHTISWEPNPLNSQFVIAEYRIYRMDIEEPVGIVSGDTFEYVDRVRDIIQTFSYFVTSVDSDGHESPASSTVLGE